MKTSITFEIDTDRLDGYTDQYLAQLWHIAQANPADVGHMEASELAEKIGFEIIKRWMASVPAQLPCRAPSGWRPGRRFGAFGSFRPSGSRR